MELRHLRYFVAVAEAEHVGKAAKQLHVSQSPLSRQIAQLEDEIGVALFERVGRGVKLSAPGRIFLEGARATLARAALAVDDARAASQGRIGTVTIGFEGGLAYTGLLPKAVTKFRAKHPHVEIRLQPIPSEEQATALRDGVISFGFGYHATERGSDVRYRILFRDRIGVVFPKQHRLAGRRTLRIADLKDERFIWSPRREIPHLYDDVIAAFHARGQTLQIAHEERDGEALLMLVASGAGLSFFAESTASIVRIGARLKRVRDLNVDIVGRALWLAAHEKDPLIASLLAITSSVYQGTS